MKVFVTGVSGFVGGHVIEALSKRHEVMAMARSPKSAAAVKAYGATPVTADLDAVVHCAAYVEEWGTREPFWKGNVEGTTRMLDVAREVTVDTAKARRALGYAPVIDVAAGLAALR